MKKHKLVNELLKVTLVLTITSVTFSGCGAPQRRIEPYISLFHDESVKPQLGKETSVGIGDYLYTETTMKSGKIATLTTQAKGKMSAFTTYDALFPKGISGELRKDHKHGYNSICFDYYIEKKYHVCLLDTNNDNKFDTTMWKNIDEYFKLQEYGEYTTKVNKERIKDSFTKAIVYNGIDNNSVKITYREFYNNMARGAYTQSDVKYKLNDDKSTVISYKGARIKVLKADGINIKYIVEKGFN